MRVVRTPTKLEITLDFEARLDHVLGRAERVQQPAPAHDVHAHDDECGATECHDQCSADVLAEPRAESADHQLGATTLVAPRAVLTFTSIPVRKSFQMRRVGCLAAIASLAFVAPPETTSAQDAGNVAAADFEAALPLSRPPPEYPWSSRVGGKEGWVLVSYVISPTGEVTEPMIEDSSGREDLERSALAGVTAWRYSPAIQNGQPVEQSMTKVRIVFQMDGGNAPGARSSFRNKYRKVVDLIAAKDFAKAAPLIDELEFGERANLYEDAWFWWLKYTYLDASGSEDQQLKRKALRLAIGYEVDYLPADQFVAAAQALYVLELRLGNFSEVLRVHERLRSSELAKESKYFEPVLAALAPSRQQIEQTIEADASIVFLGEIGNHEYWVHDLLRRSFSVSRVMGNVESVDIRCTRGTKRYDTFSEGNVWHVPESWGECGVYIKGTPGTTLALEEHPRR